MTKYTVLSPIGKDKKRYLPGHPKLGTIELTDKEAQPLLDAKVVCLPGDEPKTVGAETPGELVDTDEIKELLSENERLTKENEELSEKVTVFESAASEGERQSILADIPVEGRTKIVGVMKAMIEAKEGCGDDGIPNVKELNINLKDVTTVKVNAALRNALMGEI